MLSESIVKSLAVTLLLALATATHPLLAIPGACDMNGERQAMTCAGCCALNSCCAPSEQEESTPVTAVLLKGPFGALPVPLSQMVAIAAPLFHEIDLPKFAPGFGDAHAPPLWALNCIQLI